MKIRVRGFEEAFKRIKREPWYASRVGEIFIVDFEDDKAYIVKEYHGSVLKEDAEITEE